MASEASSSTAASSSSSAHAMMQYEDLRLSPQDANNRVVKVASSIPPVSTESHSSLQGRIKGLQQMLDAALNLARFDSGLFPDDFPVHPAVLLRKDDKSKPMIQIALYKAEQDGVDQPLLSIFESRKTDAGDYEKGLIGYAIQFAILRGYWRAIPRVVASICQFNGPREKDREELESAAYAGDFEKVHHLIEKLKGTTFTVLDTARNEKAPRGKSFQIFFRTAEKVAYLAALRSGQLEKRFGDFLKSQTKLASSPF